MLNDRLTALTDYPFDRLRALLRDLEPPAGRSEIGMHIGEPKHDPPPLLADAIAANADQWNRYPPPAGGDELVGAIKDWLDRRFGLPVDFIGPDSIVGVAGTREALFLAAIAALPRELADGQPPVVLMPNPLYAVYYGAAMLAGAEPVLLPATAQNGFQPDISDLDPALLARTGLAYINSPSNPQGAVASADKITAAIEAARAHDFLVAFDECYSEIYVDQAPPGALTSCVDLGGGVDNVAVFHSLSKRSSAPGLRSGFAAGDARFIRAFKVLRQYGGPTLPVPIQAASAALWRDETHVEQNRELYRQKFDVALEVLDGRFAAARPGGGFFLWLDVGDGEAAARSLWEKGGVKVLPGAYYGQARGGVNPGSNFIRVAIVHDVETVRDGITRIVDILA